MTGPTDTIRRARKLRSETTLAETLLWRELRKRPGGLKFRRQHPAGIYVLDFYCAAAKLAIEVDGFGHDCADVARRDAARSHFLRSQGVATTRIPAQAVLEDIEPVLLRIVEICAERVQRRQEKPPVPLNQPAAGPPPPRGRNDPPRHGEGDHAKHGGGASAAVSPMLACYPSNR